jgi:magnesium transporter
MKQAVLSKHVTWNNIEKPEAEELAAVVRDVELLPVDAEFIVRGSSRPEITVRPHYTSILVHVPLFHKTTRVTRGVSLFFLIKGQQLVTLHHQPIVVLQGIIQNFVDNPDRQLDGFGDTAMSLALHIIAELNTASFHKLHRLQKHIDIAEDAVFAGNERKMVEEIAILIRDVMDFRKVIRPQRDLFLPPTPPHIDEESQAQWLRLHGQSQKLWEVLEGIFESVKELSATNNALLQQKLNDLLRILTLYSIISIPAFILLTPFNPKGAAFDSPSFLIFWGTFALFVLWLLVIYWRFKRKRVL